MTTLLHLPVPSLKNKNASLKSLFNFGCSDQWLVTVITGWQERRPLCRAGRTSRVVSFTCASWWLIPLRVGDVGSTGWLGVQSRARSGWVFSFSPLSSCFRVPASTTDWDLIIGKGKRCDYRQSMVLAILESWRAFRLHGSLINQDAHLYNFSPLCISIFHAFVSSTSCF